MGITPWFRGDGKPWAFGLEPDSGVFDIAGVSPSDFTLVLVDKTNPQNVRVGTGTFSDLVAASGGNPASITYQESPDDVAVVGDFDLRAVFKRGNPTQQLTFDFGTWSLVP
jgi:hypothetical protein